MNMNGSSYTDYHTAHIVVAFVAFFVGVSGSVLSALWVSTLMRGTGIFRFLLSFIAGVSGFLTFWFTAFWVTRAMGLWKYQKDSESPYVWQFGVAWMIIVLMSYGLSKLHKYSASIKARHHTI